MCVKCVLHRSSRYLLTAASSGKSMVTASAAANAKLRAEGAPADLRVCSEPKKTESNCRMRDEAPWVARGLGAFTALQGAALAPVPDATTPGAGTHRAVAESSTMKPEQRGTTVGTQQLHGVDTCVSQRCTLYLGPLSTRRKEARQVARPKRADEKRLLALQPAESHAELSARL